MKLTVSEILRLDALAGSIVMSGDASDFERPVVGMWLWEGDDCPEDVREKLVFWQASHEQLDAATLCACACRSQEGGASGLVVLADSADCLAGVCTALDAPALPVIGLPWTGGALQ
ncbi:MAG TPA: hypothetical protein VMU90_12190, partial [Solirubrobacteraceae bacterium]|nr:hypothetical protein [Solirubrobacteraceae bacterium]